MEVLEIIFIVLFLACIAYNAFCDRARVRYLEREVEEFERVQSKRLSIYITEFDERLKKLEKILELDK